MKVLLRSHSILPADDAVFHNLGLKYTGAHCIFGGDMGYDVSFCEIGWIGGSPQYYRYDNAEPVILGNGVECDDSYDHSSVTDCYIYQCYDAGVSNQDPSESPEVLGNEQTESGDIIQRNISYARNVFAYCKLSLKSSQGLRKCLQELLPDASLQNLLQPGRRFNRNLIFLLTILLLSRETNR